MFLSWFKTLVIAVLLAMFFTWFTLANSQIVTVSLLLWAKQISLSLVILVSVLVGIILTGIVAILEQSKFLKKIKDLEGKLKHDEDLLQTPKAENK